MSKSRGNVQDPDELVAQYGADTVRLFLMFMGPWDQGGPWSPTGIGGVARLLGRAGPWRSIRTDEPGDPASGSLPAGEHSGAAERTIRGAAHRTLAAVTADYEGYRFNTMVARLMELSNLLFRYRGTEVAGRAAWDEAIWMLLLMLAPAAPHVTEELWSRRLAARGEAWRSIHASAGPRLTKPPPPSKPGSCRSRSTARSVTGWTSRSGSPKARWRRSSWPAPRSSPPWPGRCPTA